MDLDMLRSDAAPAAIGPYSQAVRVGDMLFCSGQIALDPATGEMVGGGDVAAETGRVMANLQAVLQAAGLEFARAVKTTIYLADLADFGAVNEVYARSFDAEHRPARACVEVSKLPRGARVEIELIAAY
ncbi:MAG: RidA family protein [Deltaproteobacteria bacterium]|nr:RidA family protein [Deltaproteobacteria bacterium]